MRRDRKISVLSLAWLLLLLGSGTAAAQAQGFSLNRYHPTPAGEWSFAVDHPWYSSIRGFAAGLTLNYGHNPLVFGMKDANGNLVDPVTSALEHQMLLHLDAAFSLADRVTVSASLPIVLVERGNEVNGFKPAEGVGVGDPRLGIMVRLAGQPDSSPISLSIGISAWLPVGGSESQHAGDPSVRVLPKLVLGGFAGKLRWSFTGGFMYRPEAVIGNGPAGAGNSIGSEVQLGALLQYADKNRGFAIGPEATLATVVVGGDAFAKDYTSLEVLLGAHYSIAKTVLVGLAGGIGVLREPGTPDGRVLLRIAYAPFAPPPKPAPADRDGDGILDGEDACIDTPGQRDADPAKNGCPPPPDRDKDGILDADDPCPDDPPGDHPDPDRKGCPDKDTDGDGVYDSEDLCKTEPKGDHPDGKRKGCPATDKDGDGVYDDTDQCIDIAAGPYPDEAKPGCPLPDRDKDVIVDRDDACPDVPGAPSPDPKKNGCPGLVLIQENQIRILEQVYFATNKDVILPKSGPVLEAVKHALESQKQIKRVSIEGHTDNRGKPEKNKDLSERRAKSVMKWLVDRGIAAERLEAHGFGQEKPIDTNKTDAGRARNRRVEFHILDPAPPKPPAVNEQPAP